MPGIVMYLDPKLKLASGPVSLSFKGIDPGYELGEFINWSFIFLNPHPAIGIGCVAVMGI